MAMMVGEDNKYRFGFYGKENDNEVKGGDGLQQDYGMRVYDNRLGRFLSVDPLAKAYPQLAPYQFASNSPILGIDLDGLEFYNSNNSRIILSLQYNPQLGKITSASTYFRIDKVPDGLATAIENANTCPNCIGSNANEVASFRYIELSPLIKTAYAAEAKDIEISENTSVGPFTQGSQTAIVPKNKKEAAQQEKTRTYLTEGSSKAVEKFGVKMAVIDVAASLIQWAGSENIEMIINKARAQSANGAAATISILQKAIDNGVLGKNTDDASLIAVANYILYGKTIEKRIVDKGEIKYVKDDQLTGIAQKLFSEYIAPINAEKQKEETKKDRKVKKDNTSPSGTGF